MFGQGLRSFAIDLLDDEHGINSVSWKALADMLEDDDHFDITAMVKVQDNRFCLTSEDANTLRQVVLEDDEDLDEEDEFEDEEDLG